jgi:hypothetical protein
MIGLEANGRQMISRAAAVHGQANISVWQITTGFSFVVRASPNPFILSVNHEYIKSHMELHA